VWFDVGQFAVQVRFDVDSGLQVVQWDHVTQFKLNNGQILAVPSRHERPAAGRDTLYGAPAINHPLYWLRTYRPQYDVDRFSPILQHQLAQAYAGRPAPRVIRRDEEGRTYTWTLTGELVMWKDGRGRVIHE
jgi:hypothetical protein